MMARHLRECFTDIIGVARAANDLMDFPERLGEHARQAGVSTEYHVFVLVAAVYGSISVSLSATHLRTYFLTRDGATPILSKTQRRLRSCLCFIVGAVPVTTILAALKVLFFQAFLGFELLRASYEAFALYMFFELIVYFLGGPNRAVAHFAEHEPRHIFSAFPCCFLSWFMKPTTLSAEGLKWTRRGALQICFTRPAVAFTSITLHFYGYSTDDIFDIYQPGLYLQLIDYGSFIVTFYCLFVLYFSSSNVLVNHKVFIPWFIMLADLLYSQIEFKFMALKVLFCIPMIHMFVFSMLLSTKVIKETSFYSAEHRSVVIDSALTCLEMVAMSKLFSHAFPTSLIQNQNLDEKELASRSIFLSTSL
jgi:hypothetical protein